MGGRKISTAIDDGRDRAAPEDLSPSLESEGDCGGGGWLGTVRRRWWIWLPFTAAITATVVVCAVFGREVVGNALAALEIAGLSGKVPGWAVLLAPVAVVVALGLAVAYLALGGHLAIKLALVVVVALALATPGLAVGYANGTVNVVSTQSPAVVKAVKAAEKELDRPIPNKAMNILLIGSDKSSSADPGRSDTQLLVRLDPETKSISMLSIPRDLRVSIPGVGYEKMNAAYAYGGPKLVVKTFKQLTGLPINHFIEINFAGFWHVVNILGGVYIPVDHRYFVPASADYKSIDLQPGYQLVRGKQALNYVRFRHDTLCDFGRMQRQQLFLKELQRQSGRWSSDWKKVIRLMRAITGQTTSDLDSLRKLKTLVELAFQVDTSKVYTVHLQGSTPTIDGVSYVTASKSQIAAAVKTFKDPQQAPIATRTLKVPKKQYPVVVYGRSATLATRVASQLGKQGYRATATATASLDTETATVVYAPKSLKTQATVIGEMLWPSDVRIVARAPGVRDGVTVFLGSSFDGTIEVPQDENDSEQQTLARHEKTDWSLWRALDKKSPLHLEAPTAWPSGSSYDQFRSYSVKNTDGKRTAAAVVVAETSDYGYWSVQAMRWTDPPAIANPSSTQTIDGRTYMLFYQGDNLHMVAWKEYSALYWVLNTLDNQLSNDVMLSLATSCTPVK
jgi:LCP family protein required for cell wall assembly